MSTDQPTVVANPHLNEGWVLAYMSPALGGPVIVVRDTEAKAMVEKAWDEHEQQRLGFESVTAWVADRVFHGRGSGR